MLSKRQSKYFKSLQLKKYRQSEELFLVEGAKGVEEVLHSSFEVAFLLATPNFLTALSPKLLEEVGEVIQVKEGDLVQIGTFKSNNSTIAVVKMPSQKSVENINDSLVLALDGVSDPGNLGTIIRIADWYGIKTIICSNDTADLFNPKVINSTMGSFTRVEVIYADLNQYLSQSRRKVYGALLEGSSIYDAQLQEGIILMGSESHGISEELRPFVTDAIRIPGRGGAESLNVAVATAVVLDNFFRA
ncbi:MAG TPA: RNA methyltransferase [Roseivirga sp.]